MLLDTADDRRRYLGVGFPQQLARDDAPVDVREALTTDIRRVVERLVIAEHLTGAGEPRRIEPRDGMSDFRLRASPEGGLSQKTHSGVNLVGGVRRHNGYVSVIAGSVTGTGDKLARLEAKRSQDAV